MMTRWLAPILTALLLATPARAETLQVAVASNFAHVVARIAPLFEKATGHAIATTEGSTGALVATIVRDAPYDILLAADAARPFELERRGFVIKEGRFTYADGRLILISHKEGLPPGPSALSDDATEKIVIAEPVNAPYGEAAGEVLRRLSVFDKRRMVYEGNVEQVLDAVAERKGVFGIVPASLKGHGENQGVLTVWDIPETMHPPIVQQGVILKGGGRIMRWLDGSSPFLRASLRPLKSSPKRGIGFPTLPPSRRWL